MLTSVGETTVAELQTEFGNYSVIFLYGDVTKQDVMEEVFNKIIAEFGKLDIFINNAGIGGMNLEPTLTIGINGVSII